MSYSDIALVDHNFWDPIQFNRGTAKYITRVIVEIVKRNCITEMNYSFVTLSSAGRTS